jgi:hypothetical protein
MRDFRRFRDALLQLEASIDLDLDGAADHPARDLDLDGVVRAPDLENVFPRYDFNGDGRIDRTATAFVGGLFGAELTDLEVLMAVWADPDVEAAALIDLIDSGDLHVHGDDAFLDPEVTDVEITLTPQGGGEPTVITLAGAPSRVLTLPVGTYDVETRFLGGGLLVLHEEEVTITLGGDHRLVPRAVALAPLDVTLDTGEVETFTAKAYGFTDSRVTWTATGGTITSTGRYTAGSTPGIYQVVARSLVDPSVRRTARVEIQEEEEEPDDTSPGVGIEFRSRGQSSTEEMLAVSIGVYDDVRRYYEADTAAIDSFDTGPFQAVASSSGAYGSGGISSSARGEIDETLRFTDRFKGFTHTFDFRVEASASSGGADKEAKAGTSIRGCINFEVTGKPAQFTFDVTVTANSYATVTSNSYVWVSVDLSTHAPDAFEKEIDGAGSFTATGELPAGGSSPSLCYWIEAETTEQRPAPSYATVPPLVEGTVTMTLSLRQP